MVHRMGKWEEDKREEVRGMVDGSDKKRNYAMKRTKVAAYVTLFKYARPGLRKSLWADVALDASFQALKPRSRGLKIYGHCYKVTVL